MDIELAILTTLLVITVVLLLVAVVGLTVSAVRANREAIERRAAARAAWKGRTTVAS